MVLQGFLEPHQHSPSKGVDSVKVEVGVRSSAPVAQTCVSEALSWATEEALLTMESQSRHNSVHLEVVEMVNEAGPIWHNYSTGG